MPASSVQYPPARRLGPADLAACVALAVSRGWAPERPKWALLLDASEAFGIDAPDGAPPDGLPGAPPDALPGSPPGGLAGAVVLTRWGPDLASVGMMLVAARHARRGLGRALMEQLLVAAGHATVTLYATDMGRPLYEKLGFKQVSRNLAVAGWFRPPRPVPDHSTPGGLPGDTAAPAGSVIRAAAGADLAAILAVDRVAFGADRSAILTRLPGFAERILVLESGTPEAGTPEAGTPEAGTPESGTARDGPRVVGYAAAWRNGPNTVIGPVVAPDTGGAKLLIAELASRARGPVRLDLDPDRPELPAWAGAHGLRPISGNAVMARGEYTERGIPSRLHTPISIALA
jgi:ribosomal protein S18 acetylase RimI-like enzyme